MLADIERLEKLIADFKFWSRPSSGLASTQCTVGDLNKVIDNLAKVLEAIVDEMKSD